MKIVEPHAYGSDFSGYIQRGEQIVICLVLRVAKLPHLVIVELHVLVAQPEADVEAAEPLRDLDERRYVALVNPVVGIRNLGDIGRKEIGGARIGVFLIELNKYLESIRARISEIHAQLVKDEELINPVVLKNHYLGNIAGPRMLVETFNGVVAQYKEKLEMGDICLCTFLRWERCGIYLSEFLSKREGSPDIPIKVQPSAIAYLSLPV